MKLPFLPLKAVYSVALGLALAGCGGTTMDGPALNSIAASSTTTPKSKHVVIVMEENRGYSSVVGVTSGWPHLNALIGKGAPATHYYASTHPSIGNYFMLTTGQILTNSDKSDCDFHVDFL